MQDEDSFDQLLNSGKTIKLSSTPDRLRFEVCRAPRFLFPVANAFAYV